MAAVAVMVDAGYLTKAGANALTGKSPKREFIKCSPIALYGEIMLVVTNRCSGSRLLRIYWYDGAKPNGERFPEQDVVASQDFFKVRLGLISSQFGDPNAKQKGVDSLIVSDLIELARNRAVTDVILLSGDLDVRVGVQIAQSYGVQVHLVGIEGSDVNQHQQLKEEADTTTLWVKEVVQKFMTVDADFIESGGPRAAARIPSVDPNLKLLLTRAIEEFIGNQIPEEEVKRLGSQFLSMPNASNNRDRPLLATCGAAKGGHLTNDEKIYMRSEFRRLILQKAGLMEQIEATPSPAGADI